MEVSLEQALEQELKDPAHDLAPPPGLDQMICRLVASRRRRRTVMSVAASSVMLAGAGVLWGVSTGSADHGTHDSVASGLPTSLPTSEPSAATTIRPGTDATPDPSHIYLYGFAPGYVNAYVEVAPTPPKHSVADVLSYFRTHDSQAPEIGSRLPDATHFWLYTDDRGHHRAPMWFLQWKGVTATGPDAPATATKCVATYLYDDNAGVGLESGDTCPGRLFTNDHVQPRARTGN